LLCNGHAPLGCRVERILLSARSLEYNSIHDQSSMRARLGRFCFIMQTPARILRLAGKIRQKWEGHFQPWRKT
jgi:hypothetical protein